MPILNRKNIVNIIIAAGFLIIAGISYYIISAQFYIFEGVKGPSEPSTVTVSVKDPLKRYATGSESRLSIFLTDLNSSWLGLAHGLKAVGIPFTVTTDYREALRHRMVLVYPMISGRTLSSEALRALAAYPRKGGTLIGFNVLGGGLNQIFGFTDALPSREHSVVRLNTDHPLTGSFTEPEEQVLTLYHEDRKHGPGSTMGSYSYSLPIKQPLAVYEDGSAAITEKFYSQGGAYAFGLDVGHLILKAHNFRYDGMAFNYVNGYKPAIDVFLRIIKKIYLSAVPYGVTIHTVPFNKSLSVMITHDVDYSGSVGNSLIYGRYEHDEGIRATYFIQTKYVRDWSDEIFFSDEKVPVVVQLEKWGMEVGSHSVSHAVLFSEFPLGTGTEQYPGYKPVVKNESKTRRGTILGELRVSRFLLEHFTKKGRVLSFRPGHLSIPVVLPQALEATGYLYSSSVTANRTLTHLPFQMNYNREYETEVPVYEFPITIEDEHLPEMDRRLPQAIELADKIRKYGGIYVVLIHPDITDHKMRFLKGFIPAVRDYAWFGTVAEFGAWWSARDRIDLDVFPEKNTLIISLKVPEEMAGLTLVIPEGYRYAPAQPEPGGIRQSGDRIVIDRAAGEFNIRLAAE